MTTVRDLLPVLVPLATVGAATIAAIPVYRQFKLRVAEENRLAVANRAELDVRLLTLFTELMGRHTLVDRVFSPRAPLPR
jgi:hypothetical protein